jgi:hypothetical protein
MINVFKKILFVCILFIANSCADKQNLLPAEDALDAVRLFKDAYQNGNYEKAKFYCVDDNANKLNLDLIFKNYQNLSNQEKTQLKSAPIIILKNESIDEHTSQIIISNNKNINSNDTFKVVNMNNTWLIKLSN